MRSVSKFPLGPLPWTLAEPMGTLKKTSNATLLHKLEGTVEPMERVSVIMQWSLMEWHMSNSLKSPTKPLANFIRIC